MIKRITFLLVVTSTVLYSALPADFQVSADQVKTFFVGIRYHYFTYQAVLQPFEKLPAIVRNLIRKNEKYALFLVDQIQTLSRQITQLEQVRMRFLNEIRQLTQLLNQTELHGKKYQEIIAQREQSLVVVRSQANEIENKKLMLERWKIVLHRIMQSSADQLACEDFTNFSEPADRDIDEITNASLSDVDSAAMSRENSWNYMPG